MQQKTSSAAIDADFIIHLVSTRISDDSLVKYVSSALNALNLEAVINPLVYEKEVPLNNKRINLLFSEKVLQKIEFEYIFNQDPGGKNYYIYLVRGLFSRLKHKNIPVKDDEVLSYWQRRSSLGEIHSVAMCALCNYGMFLSDDDDSKKLENFLVHVFRKQIKVYDRGEFFKKAENDTALHIPSGVRHKLSHKRDT